VDRDDREVGRILQEYESACKDAALDLRTLGFRPSVSMIFGYLAEIVFLPSPISTHGGETNAILEGAAANTTKDVRRHLPFPIPRPWKERPIRRWSKAAEIRQMKRDRVEIDRAFRKDPELLWSREVRYVIQVRIAHQHAVAFRDRYFRLLRASTLPSAAAWQAEFSKRLGPLTRNRKRLSVELVDHVVGRSAAAVSTRMVESIDWELRETDRLLQPRGSYLSSGGAPQQLRLWPEFDHWLRQALRNLPSEWARSRAIAATLMAFAGDTFNHAGAVDDVARNAVEKWRRRTAHRAAEFDQKWLRGAGFGARIGWMSETGEARGSPAP
jgi:hypothetical protein